MYSHLDDPDVVALWDAAFERNDELSVFLSRHWLTAWAESYTDFDDLKILVSEDDAAGVAVLPMMTYQDRLRSLSYNATDYTGVIYPKGACPDLGDLVQVLRTAPLPVRLWNISEHDPLFAELTRKGLTSEVARTITRQTNLLRLAREDAPIRASSTFREAARLRRRAMDLGFVFAWEPREDVDPDELVRLHTRRWQASGEPGNFGDPRRGLLLRRVLQCGQLDPRVLTLREGSRLLSYRVSFIRGTSFAAWNSGYDVEYRQRSPGTVLLLEEMERALALGLETYDFLRGDEEYKVHWTDRQTWVVHAEILRYRV